MGEAKFKPVKGKKKEEVKELSDQELFEQGCAKRDEKDADPSLHSFVRDMLVIFTREEIERVQGDVNAAREEVDEPFVDKVQKLLKTMTAARNELVKSGKVTASKYPPQSELEDMYAAYVNLEQYIMEEGKKAIAELNRQRMEALAPILNS